MRYLLTAALVLIVIVLFAIGLRGHEFTSTPFQLFPDMDHQAKVKAQAPSEFFADGLGSRQPVSNTVPMGYEMPEKTAQETNGAHPDFGFSFGASYYDTGRMGDFYGDGIPGGITVDAALLARGQERYDIYCAVCHGAAGDGKGIITQYSPTLPANFLTPEFTDPSNPVYRPDGSLFATITDGKGLMGSYGASITVRDRWAIVSYLRALQVSVGSDVAAVDAE